MNTILDISIHKPFSRNKYPPPPQNTVSKWRSMIYFASYHFNFGKNIKNHFSKGVFQWNLSHGFSGKSYFPASPKCWFMLISEKTTGFVWFIYLFWFYFVLFDFWFLFIYLFIYLFIFFLRQKKIVIKYWGLRKTVVGPVGTPSLVRLSHVLGVNITFWYDHFDTLVLVS